MAEEDDGLDVWDIVAPVGAAALAAGITGGRRGILRARNRKLIAGDVSKYQEMYEGAQQFHKDPSKWRNINSRAQTDSGTFRRGVHSSSAEYDQLNNLKPGQTWAPGKALSMDQGGAATHSQKSQQAPTRNIFGQPAGNPAHANKPGAYVYVTTKNGRRLSRKGIDGAKWDESVTTPNARYRVDRVVRDADGNLTEVHVTDLSSPGLGRAISDKAMTIAGVGGALAGAEADAAVRKKK